MIYLLTFFYTLLQIVFTPIAVLYMLFRYRKKKHSLHFIKEKLIAPTVSLAKSKKTRIWLHAVSVGEIAACKGILKELLKKCPAELVVSSSTATGVKQAKIAFPEACLHFLLPIDYPWNVRSLFSSIRPSFLLLGESDFWVNLLGSAHFFNVPVILLNGKLSARSVKRFSFIAPISSLLFSLIDHFFVQDDIHEKRFLQFVNQNKITVSGNSKLDMPLAVPSNAWLNGCKSKKWIEDGDFVVVAGSTHDEEEKFLLDQLSILNKQMPLKLVLVPRHPERFAFVEKLLQKKKFNYVKTSSEDVIKEQVQVILVDQMGTLGFWYSVAQVAVVCGSFIGKVGGHNLIEPHYFGVPVLYGPHVFSQKHLDFLVKRYKSGLQVSQDQFSKVLLDLYEHPEKREELSFGAKRLIADHKGVCEGVAEKIAKKYGNTIALKSSAC